MGYVGISEIDFDHVTWINSYLLTKVIKPDFEKTWVRSISKYSSLAIEDFIYPGIDAPYYLQYGLCTSENRYTILIYNCSK